MTNNTDVSTPQIILEKPDSQSHVYTYIHTYMEKRTKKETTTNTNVIFYDGLDLTQLKEISFRNGTNVSSIVSNLIREFNLLFKSETPQKTLFNFDESQQDQGLSFDVENRELKQILLSKTDEEFAAWESKLEEILSVTSKAYKIRQSS